MSGWLPGIELETYFKCVVCCEPVRRSVLVVIAVRCTKCYSDARKRFGKTDSRGTLEQVAWPIPWPELTKGDDDE